MYDRPERTIRALLPGPMATLCLLFILSAASPGLAQDTGASGPPDNPETIVSKAHALRDQGKADEAEALLKEADERQPDNPLILGELAEAINDQERTAEALHLYERIVALDQEDIGARLRLADFYLWTGQQEKALGHYLAVHEKRPHDPSLQLKVANILIAMDRTEEALPYLESYNSAVPGDIAGMKTLYQAYLWTEKPDKACTVLEKMVELDPDDMHLTREIAMRYLESSQELKAISKYETIVEKQPTDLKARSTLAQLYEWNDMPIEALEQYELYLEMEPSDQKIRARALEISMDLGYGNKARTHAGTLGASDPRYDKLARRALLLEQGVGSALGTEYMWFSHSQGFDHHAWGLWGSLGVNSEVTLGAFYKFHYFRGPESLNSPGQKETIYGHQPGLFGTFKMPRQWTLRFDLSMNKYHGYTSWSSWVNARLELKRDFGVVALLLYGERSDKRSWLGSITDQIVGNTGGMELYITPVERFFIGLSGEYTWLNSKHVLNENHCIYGEANVGYVIFELPRFVASYTYNIEHYTGNSPNFTYLDGTGRKYYHPNASHTHGPGLVLRHPVSTWFLYGLDLYLRHLVNDDSLSLTYGANVEFHPGKRHHLSLSYLRTDTVYGTTSTAYKQNVLIATYTFEF